MILIKFKFFPRGNENILSQTNAISIFQDYQELRDAGQFLLRRNNDKELEIPLEYTDELHTLCQGSQCASETVTVFKKGSLPDFGPEFIKGSPKLYCNKGNQECKNLYDLLKHHALFYKVNSLSKLSKIK